jgi:hypothetical protein
LIPGFLLDEDIHPGAAPAARDRGLDVVSVHEIGRTGSRYSDESQLRHAASEGRVMVTRNRDDFIRLTREFFRTGEPHCGLLVVPHTLPNTRPGRIAPALERWCGRISGGATPGYVIDFLDG